MTLADILGAPTTFELDGETFRIGPPTLMHQGEYQTWLEQLAFDAINRRVYQDEREKLACLRMHDENCAAGAYEWGGDIACRRLCTASGLAKLLAIMCRDQGLTEKKAERLVGLEQRKLAAVMAARRTDDPKVLAAVLATLGLPSDFYSSSSPTPPSTAASTTCPG